MTTTIASGGAITLRGLGGGNTAANLYITDSDSTNTGTDATSHLNLNGAGEVDMKINSLVIGRIGLS